MTVRRRNFIQGALGAAAGLLGAVWAGRADAQQAGHVARPAAGQARGAAPTAKAISPTPIMSFGN